MSDLLTDSLDEAQSAPEQPADDAALIAWKMRRRQWAEQEADREAEVEATRRGRPLYWRQWTVDLPAEFATEKSPTWTIRKRATQVAHPADGAMSGGYLLGLSGQAARIAADQARRDGIPVSEVERDAIGQEVAVSLLSGGEGRPLRTERDADLANATGIARTIIKRGAELGDRASWRDHYGFTSWGAALSDDPDAGTLADVTGEDDVTLGAELDSAERDAYLDGPRNLAPLAHADEASVRLTGLGREARRFLAASIGGAATSADLLAAEHRPTDRNARREMRRGLERGRKATIRHLATGGAATVAATCPERRESIRPDKAEPISASRAARALKLAQRSRRRVLPNATVGAARLLQAVAADHADRIAAANPPRETDHRRAARPTQFGPLTERVGKVAAKVSQPPLAPLSARVADRPLPDAAPTTERPTGSVPPPIQRETVETPKGRARRLADEADKRRRADWRRAMRERRTK